MHYDTPTAPDIYTRYWQEAIQYDQMLTVPTGFQSLFGPSQGAGGKTVFVRDSSRVDFDVRNSKQEITTLIHRGTVAQPLNKDMVIADQFTSFSRAFPLGEDYGVISADQLMSRGFGESPYAQVSKFSRMRRIASDQYDEMIRRAIRTQEILAVQMIKTGKMDMIIGTSKPDEQIDTKRLASHTLTIGASWATAGTSILDDCDTAFDLILQDSGAIMDTIIVGGNVPSYIANNTEIQTYANIMGAANTGFALIYFGENFKPGAKYTNLLKHNFTPIGQLITGRGRRISVFSTEGGYKNKAGTFIPYLADDEVIFMTMSARNDRFFGPEERLPMTAQERTDYAEIFGFDLASPPIPANVENAATTIVPQAFYPDVIRSRDGKSLMPRLQWAPMYITVDTNAYCFADVTP